MRTATRYMMESKRLRGILPENDENEDTVTDSSAEEADKTLWSGPWKDLRRMRAAADDQSVDVSVTRVAEQNVAHGNEGTTDDHRHDDKGKVSVSKRGVRGGAPTEAIAIDPASALKRKENVRRLKFARYFGMSWWKWEKRLVLQEDRARVRALGVQAIRRSRTRRLVFGCENGTRRIDSRGNRKETTLCPYYIYSTTINATATEFGVRLAILGKNDEFVLQDDPSSEPKLTKSKI